MNEKELIGKLRELRQIRPSQNWVVLTKKQILGQETLRRQPFYHLPVFGRHRSRVSGSFFSVFRLGLAMVTLFVILFGLFGISQKSLPGDLLYPVKKITEKSRAVFVSDEEKPQASLELADKRLTELTKIAQTNQVKKLAPAINEFEDSVSEAANNLSRIETTSSDPLVVKRMVDQAKNIEKRVKEVESLGVVVGEEELNQLAKVSTKLELELLISVLKNLILDLENRTLTEKQKEILSQMKELVEQEKYSEALELYLTNQQIK